jgi:hypothetical protein
MNAPAGFDASKARFKEVEKKGKLSRADKEVFLFTHPYWRAHALLAVCFAE